MSIENEPLCLKITKNVSFSNLKINFLNSEKNRQISRDKRQIVNESIILTEFL